MTAGDLFECVLGHGARCRRCCAQPSARITLGPDAWRFGFLLAAIIKFTSYENSNIRNKGIKQIFIKYQL